MKFATFRRVLALGVLGLLLAVVAGIWLLGTHWGRQQLERIIRERVAQQSDLVLGPMDIDFSLWRDFPHLTASVENLALTDTSFRRSVPVLRVGRADIRLELRQIWRGEFRVRHLTLRDAEFRQLTDSLGRDWGLRGKGPRKRRPSAPPDFDLDSLVLLNVRVTDRNDLHHSGFSTHVQQGRLIVRTRSGRAQVRGRLQGQLEYLRSSRGNLFEQEPIVARIRYQYDFRQRQGTFRRTLATLNGDTVQIGGTHRAASPGEPRGTHLNLTFEGNQPLLEILHTALPPGLERYLRGARSPSHAHIHYSIRGLSGPTTRPRTVLQFAMRNAQLQWADSSRRIKRWDARGVFDNGPEHDSRTTYLRFEQCRLYSDAGQLDAAITVRDFTHPHLLGRLRGRTELQTLASVVVPTLWQARGGRAAIDLRLNGTIPNIPDRAARRSAVADTILPPISARGTVQLEQAAFDIPSRRARMTGLNVRVRMLDSEWRLENLTGRLNGMRVQANATTHYLLAYFSGQHPTTSVAGTFAVDELRLPELQRLLAAPGTSRRPAARPVRRGYTRNQALASRVLNVLPPGLRLQVQLRCGRLVIATDTLQQLAATVLHDGRHVELRNLQARLWGGQLRGGVSWLTDTLNLQPVTAQLSAHFPVLSYQLLLRRITRPTPRTTPRRQPNPTLRDVLLAANGEATVTIDRLVLPANDELTKLRLQLKKTATRFQIPAFTFQTGMGGQGRISAEARLNRSRLERATGQLDLQYQDLNVQSLLQLLAALSTMPAPESNRKAAARAARREAGQVSPFLDGTITGRVHVTAANMRYGALRGHKLELLSYLTGGQAKVERCSLDAFGGHVELRGVLRTDSGATYHPLHAQLQVQQVQLPEVFALAQQLGFDVLGPDNIRGTMQAEVEMKTALGPTFLPELDQTQALLRTDLHELELVDVEALMQALRILSPRRTGHLYFEPVQPRFMLDRGRLLIPGLNLSSNLTDMQVSGEYYLDGRANLYVGLSPLQALLGNNQKRIARIQSGEASRRASRGLVFVNLTRAPGTRYKVRLFKKKEQQEQQARLLREYQQQLRRQLADTSSFLLQ
ncbi:AsmA-like C-terminal region-containing protein [Hymenobacter pini]|uniref:AsmA-like C-terminal region-containing protein n=1 Tax=Hymenobacter pini TaxID=2880879 RepID=UPI001CF2E305|nr:AsmA-like C-terminal region-containing protein [Hymenobacter pini]MCA8830844.1 AsmA-like C-terminal region-containing protein [Hymenobacter pini]